MKRELLKTEDGSMTIHMPDINEQYHSKHGALQEAKHVFLKMGLEPLLDNFVNKELSILEIGFGTGLNCLLTEQKIEGFDVKVSYTGVEAFPVSLEEWKAMNYGELIGSSTSEGVYEKIHEAEWEVKSEISKSFSLTKQKKNFEDIKDSQLYDLIYFDAFGARVQPELWTENIFQLMYNALKNKGVLVTYSAKGSVRRAMQAVGFMVERLEGPPGKREMLRASKNT